MQVPSEIAPRVRPCARSLALHAEHNSLAGSPRHFARTASQAALASGDLTQYAHGDALKVHRKANRAKHSWTTASGREDPLIANDPWAAYAPRAGRSVEKVAAASCACPTSCGRCAAWSVLVDAQNAAIARMSEPPSKLCSNLVERTTTVVAGSALPVETPTEHHAKNSALLVETPFGRRVASENPALLVDTPIEKHAALENSALTVDTLIVKHAVFENSALAVDTPIVQHTAATEDVALSVETLLENSALTVERAADVEDHALTVETPVDPGRLDPEASAPEPDAAETQAARSELQARSMFRCKWKRRRARWLPKLRRTDASIEHTAVAGKRTCSNDVLEELSASLDEVSTSFAELGEQRKKLEEAQLSIDRSCATF